ncbi:MAG: hypothetical protein H7099_16415 [Gemmatimonadaceae bacterium]|nr:hypothetical protein [Gemmatimonadaceae bacterium]
MECIAIDWSGAVTGEASRIWIARAVGGTLTALFAPGGRNAVREFLLDRRRDASPALVGLDFAFGMPQWYADVRGWRAGRDVWCAARDDGEHWLRDCPPPFWGRAGTTRPHAAPLGLRQTERGWPRSPRPKSVFQVGGAGSVGTGSVRGMPMLLALSDARWAIWPFDAPSSHTIVEIYPRLFTGPVVKREGASRAAFLRANHVHVASAFRHAMQVSEDAFDAGISALVMSQCVPASLPLDVSDPIARMEGRIWAPDVVPAGASGSE